MVIDALGRATRDRIATFFQCLRTRRTRVLRVPIPKVWFKEETNNWRQEIAVRQRRRLQLLKCSAETRGMLPPESPRGARQCLSQANERLEKAPNSQRPRPRTQSFLYFDGSNPKWTTGAAKLPIKFQHAGNSSNFHQHHPAPIPQTDKLL